MSHKQAIVVAISAWVTTIAAQVDVTRESGGSVIEHHTPVRQDSAEIVELMIREANVVAKQLKLPEDLPITRSSLVSTYIVPRRFMGAELGLGNISTTNYNYYVSVGGKFSFLEKRPVKSAGEDWSAMLVNHLSPVKAMDTNAAFCLATQWLSALSIDVTALNRDCQVAIRAWTPPGTGKQQFVPLYWVSWGHSAKPAAMVELFLPTKTLNQLRVEEAKYILRDPLVSSDDTVTSKPRTKERDAVGR
jgi:hypothetical protein